MYILFALPFSAFSVHPFTCSLVPRPFLPLTFLLASRFVIVIAWGFDHRHIVICVVSSVHRRLDLGRGCWWVGGLWFIGACFDRFARVARSSFFPVPFLFRLCFALNFGSTSTLLTCFHLLYTLAFSLFVYFSPC